MNHHDEPDLLGRAAPSTPSGFHQRARQRGVTHDKMQAELLAFLRARPLAGIPLGAIVHRQVEGELPLTRRGQVVSFADAAEILTVNLATVVSLFEIKPRIDTVFGIVRQCKAMLALARACITGDQHYCHAVVPHDDPLIADLRAEWPLVWAWGVTFSPMTETDDV